MSLHSGQALREGFSALRANPLRTLLSTIGVVIGVASLTAVLALGDGVESFARKQIETTTDLQAVVVRPNTVSIFDGVRVPRTTTLRWTAAEAESLGRSIPGVEEILMQVTGEALITGDTGRPRGAIVTGRLASKGRPPVGVGRDLTAEDVRAEAKVVVVDHAFATALSSPAPAESLLGKVIAIQGTPFTVIGIDPKRSTAAQIFRIEVPYSVAEQAMIPEPRVPTVILRADSVERVAAVRRAAEEWLRVKYPNDTTIASVSTQEGRLDQVRRGLLLFKLLMGAMTGISLLVGGIGIMNVLLASVAERTREIGVRKAVGARDRDVMAQFLAESVAITGVGAAVGTVLGVGGAFGITAIMRTVTEAQVYAGLSVSTVVVAALAAVITGLVFGIYPALRAARLSPIDAIRHE